VIYNAKLNKLLHDKMDPGDNERELKELEKERGQLIDSYIVRVMKHRKVLDLRELVDEVIRLSTMFQPNILLIKKRVEQLIEKEYLKRDDDKRDRLIYVP